MLFKVIKNSLKAIMAYIAVYGVFSLTEINTFKLVLLIAFGVSAVGYVVSSAIVDKPHRLPNGPHGEAPGAVYGAPPEESLTEQQVIIEGFINDILDHCASKNRNCTLANEPDGLWVVSVNDETGKYEKIINLTLPNEKDVTRENIKGLLKRVCDEIDVKLNELKD
ncbi:hypothetical protein [uncultured Streptococcus sp.]|uniref:hypothetical protein n=1 Tax=uncultured Streptococcus sp. TaxID=83427 RepID=UPI002599C440|nr:hypothetical protein [uncultured Streptococcus sp.]